MAQVCTIYRAVAAEGSYGEDVTTYTVEANVACGFQLTGGVKVMRGDVVKVDYDAELRLATAIVPLSLNDKVVLTTQFGDTSQVTVTFDVFGYGQRGHAVWYQLKMGQSINPANLES